MDFLNNLPSMLPIILMFGVMYFFILRPKQVEMKKLEEQIRTIKKGDRILTTGGIYGTVNEVKADSFLLLIDTSTKMEITKAAVAKLLVEESK